MEEVLNVLSLFDGMSCGQIALERAGFKIDKYFVAEIDKYAMKVTQANYPDTIQLGDVRNIKADDLPKIDLLIGGSPCQGFSFAGKQLNFDDPRSKLFFEFVRLLKEAKPKYFLLENVRMKQEYQDVISKLLGVEPIMINSCLVSAQNRKRFYWTNIPDIKQPKDCGILLKDIIECGDATLKRYKEKSMHQMVQTNRCIQVGEADIKGFDCIKRVYSPEGKAPTLTTCEGGHREPKVICRVPEATKKGYIEVKEGECADLTFPKSKTRRGRAMETKSNCLIAATHEMSQLTKYGWRKLTPTECERLQTVPDNYTLVPWGNRMMSNSQRYKMLGNGWTVDVICHILKNMSI